MLFRSPEGNSTALIAAGIFASLSFGGLLYLRKRRRTSKPATLTPEGILRNGKLHPLDKQQLALIKRLKEQPGGLATAEVLEILNLNDLDYSTNTRNKNNRIARLNTELKSLFKSREDLVYEAKSDEDKRLKKYFLRNGYIS